MAELKIYQTKNNIEVGVDEAGRGCLMGRVYAAAVILPQEFSDDTYREIRDSKKLSLKKREQLRTYIQDIAIGYGIGYAEPVEVDSKNIYNATILAMHRALDKLDLCVDKIFVDGKHFKPYFDKEDNFPSYQCIVGGDDSYLNIAAASILAKCARDDHVISIVRETPQLDAYGWSRNKGYGTSEHMRALEKHGVTDHHRKSFAPCKNITWVWKKPST